MILNTTKTLQNPEPEPLPMRTFNPILQDVLLFIAAVAVYATSLGNGFVGDDLIYFIGNKALATFDVRTIIMSGALEVDYCPLRDISLALDYLIWGETPFGFHLTNLILYGFSVIAVRRLFSAIQGVLARPAAEAGLPENSAGTFMAALLFAVHPVHGEVIYAVNNRGIILAGLCFFLSCLCFINYMRKDERNAAWYAGSLALFIAALLSKEYSIILPLVLVLCVVSSCNPRRIRHLLATVPFFLISACFYFMFKSIAVSARFIAPSSESLVSGISTKLLVALEITAYYLFRIVNAEGIGTVIEQSTRKPALILIAVSVLMLAITAATAIMLRKKYPQLWFGLFLYLICLIPFLNLFKTYPIVADRFAYLPSFGLLFCATAISYRRRPSLVFGVVLIVAMSFTYMSVKQTVHWRDNISFWEYIAERDPSLSNYSNLGRAYLSANNAEMAQRAFRKALQSAPGTADDAALRGDILLMLGDNDGAIQVYKQVLDYFSSKPDSGRVITWQLYSNLSKASKNKGNYPEAIDYINKGILLKPGSAGLYNSLGVLRGEMKQFDLAITAFHTAISLDADYGFAPLNLARTYWEMGDRAQAENYLRIVRSKFPALRADADLIGSKGK
jgi:tetratricopeptide (TPR) repeat protein